MIFGAVLVVLGIVGYAGSGAESPTALIPSVVGVVLAALGFVGQQEDKRALTMHIAALVALIGFLGSAVGLFSLPELITGDDVERPWAVGVQSAMAFVLALYLGLSVRSFIAARKAREAGAG
ncbi:hypothetical protein BH23ACT1_BH23ACT1_12230 [soil metagenome]